VNNVAQVSIANKVDARVSEGLGRSDNTDVSSGETMRILKRAWAKTAASSPFSGNPIVVIGDFDDHRNSDLQSLETPHEKMHFGGAPLCG
jgi:hypothetical protein